MEGTGKTHAGKQTSGSSRRHERRNKRGWFQPPEKVGLVVFGANEEPALRHMNCACNRSLPDAIISVSVNTLTSLALPRNTLSCRRNLIYQIVAQKRNGRVGAQSEYEWICEDGILIWYSGSSRIQPSVFRFPSSPVVPPLQGPAPFSQSSAPFATPATLKSLD